MLSKAIDENFTFHRKFCRFCPAPLTTPLPISTGSGYNGTQASIKLHAHKAHHEHRKKLEHMKFLRMWAVPAHALLILWPCR